MAIAKAKAVATAGDVKNGVIKLNGDPMPSQVPNSVTLASPYGFFDADGAPNMWQAGQVVADTDEILILLERDAPLEPFTEQ